VFVAVRKSPQLRGANITEHRRTPADSVQVGAHLGEDSGRSPALFYPFSGPLLPQGLKGFTRDDSSVTKFVSTVSTYDLIPAVSDVLNFWTARWIQKLPLAISEEAAIHDFFMGD
jgi:hypothetical protein